MKNLFNGKTMDLQFFAEDSGDSGNATEDSSLKENEKNKNLKANTNTDAEDEIAKLRLENAKLKKAKDKALSETADYKKQLKNYLSEEQLKEQERAENQAKMEEELKQLKYEKQLSSLKNEFINSGYSVDVSETLAKAQADNDTDAFFKAIRKANETIVKNKENEFIKSRTQPNHSSDDETENNDNDAFAEGFNSVL